jgi:predicted metal-dependent peptidase
VTTPEDASRVAGGRIRAGIERLAGDYPYHAAVLGRLRVEARAGVGSVAVTVDGDAVLLLHEPGFVLSLAADELGGVLLHEVHHVVLGHVTADPGEFPDAWARAVAEEVTANEYVTLPLPGEPLTLGRFPGLPPRESTRRRYGRLERHEGRCRLLGPCGRAAEDAAPARPDAAPGGEVSSEERSPPSSRPARAGAVGDVRRGGPAGAPAPGRLIDDHGVWAEALRDPARSRAAVREVVELAVWEAGPAAVPDPLKPWIAAHGIGLAPGDGLERLAGAAAGRLDWRRRLRRCVGSELHPRPILGRPPRRFPELTGVLPGRGRRASRPRVLAVIDTSGSIGARDLEAIDGELARLGRQHRVTVAECDAAVRRVAPYRGRLRQVRGRGGTDLRPPLEPGFLRRWRAELVIYFTDGSGPAPAAAPGVPVIWCLVPGGRAPAAWGRTIRMEEGS